MELFPTQFLTVFDLFGNDRLSEWKNFRNSLETSQTPFEDVIAFWSKAPFVNPYLDSNDYKSWPDPWHLIIDGRFDDLAIALGIAYTLKLTERFMDDDFEIHMSIISEKKEPKYYLRIKKIVFDIAVRSIIYSDQFPENSRLIWSSKFK